MKAKMLKKIRAKYDIHYNVSENKWVLLDNSEQTVRRYKYLWEAIDKCISTVWGIGFSMGYVDKLLVRESKKEYREYKQGNKPHEQQKDTN